MAADDSVVLMKSRIPKLQFQIRDSSATQLCRMAVHQLETTVERYLAELERADRDPELVPEERAEHLSKKIAKVRAPMKVLDAIDEQLATARVGGPPPAARSAQKPPSERRR